MSCWKTVFHGYIFFTILKFKKKKKKLLENKRCSCLFRTELWLLQEAISENDQNRSRLLSLLSQMGFKTPKQKAMGETTTQIHMQRERTICWRCLQMETEQVEGWLHSEQPEFSAISCWLPESSYLFLSRHISRMGSGLLQNIKALPAQHCTGEITFTKALKRTSSFFFF